MAPNRVESKPFPGWKQFEKKGAYMEAAYTVPMTLRTLALHRVLDGNLGFSA
jgi:hypothetical protein